MSTEFDSMTWEFNCPQYVDFSSNPPKTPGRVEARAVGSTDSCDHWFTPSAKTPGHLISQPGRPEVDGLEEGSPLVLETTFRVSSGSASDQATDVPVIRPDVIPQSHSQETSSDVPKETPSNVSKEISSTVSKETSSNVPKETTSNLQRVEETPSKIPKMSAIPTSVKKTVSAAIRCSIPTSVTATTPEKQSSGGRRTSKTSPGKKKVKLLSGRRMEVSGRREEVSGRREEVSGRREEVGGSVRQKMGGSLKKDVMKARFKTPGSGRTPTSHRTPSGSSTLLQHTQASCQKKSCSKQCSKQSCSKQCSKQSCSKQCCSKQSEMEEEVVQEMKRLQFRATPVNRKILSSNSLVRGIPKVTRSRVTTVLEFKFQTDERIKIRSLRRSLLGPLGLQKASNDPSGEKENHAQGMDGPSATSSTSSLGTRHFMSQTVSSSLKSQGSSGVVPSKSQGSNAVVPSKSQGSSGVVSSKSQGSSVSSLKSQGSSGAGGTENAPKVQPKVVSRQAPKIMSRK